MNSNILIQKRFIEYAAFIGESRFLYWTFTGLQSVLVTLITPKLKNILFVCSRNKWRSLTAETVYKNHKQLIVKSAGTEKSARIKLTASLLNWADIIFVMEKHHKEKIAINFPDYQKPKDIIVLEIPDIYKYMDPELIDEIKVSVSNYI